MPAVAGSRGGAVNGGVERGVVIHLELAVNLESALAVEGLLPEVLKAGGEVIALFEEDGEAVVVSLGVAEGRVGALGLLARVEEFEGEDREAVNDEAGRLRVEQRGGVGQGARREPVKEDAVELFGVVIAELVGAVDATLDGGDFGVGCAGSASLVLDVPEVEVGAMLAGDGVEEGVRGGRGLFRIEVPEGGEAVMEVGDGLSREHR